MVNERMATRRSSSLRDQLTSDCPLIKTFFFQPFHQHLCRPLSDRCILHEGLIFVCCTKRRGGTEHPEELPHFFLLKMVTCSNLSITASRNKEERIRSIARKKYCKVANQNGLRMDRNEKLCALQNCIHKVFHLENNYWIITAKNLQQIEKYVSKMRRLCICGDCWVQMSPLYGSNIDGCGH